MDDLIQGRRYYAGPDGNQQGDSEPLLYPPPPRAEGGYRTETLTEPESWVAWLLPASLLVLGLAAGLWAVRRWRSWRAA